MSLKSQRRARLTTEADGAYGAASKPCADCVHSCEIEGCKRFGASLEIARSPSGRCGTVGRGFTPRALPGIERASVRDILQTEANRPMRGGNAELSHTSLFGDGHLQKEMF